MAMSVDVEDWFHVENLKRVVAPTSWDSRERRVEANTTRLLGLFEEARTRATFFVLGWVAERHPGLIRRIAAAGHEIASHGYGHELVYTMSPAEFRKDVERSKGLLEDITGSPVKGYRAPCFSIVDWAVDILQEIGFEYDSSAFPTVSHDRYGRLSRVDSRSPVVELRPGFFEVCISCIPLGSRGIPWGGGGYFRLLPVAAWRAGVQHIVNGGAPYVFYVHPWEIDPGQPRIPGLGLVRRFRHYVNLHRCERRLRTLLSNYQWSTTANVLSWWRERHPYEPLASAAASG
jgi:polysaccharide deacetylase family protein (PEP-CTERM system associated)